MNQSLRTAHTAAHVRLACLSLMWSLLRRVLAGGGCVSRRMEWDHDVPPFPKFTARWRGPRPRSLFRPGGAIAALPPDPLTGGWDLGHVRKYPIQLQALRARRACVFLCARGQRSCRPYNATASPIEVLVARFPVIRRLVGDESFRRHGPSIHRQRTATFRHFAALR